MLLAVAAYGQTAASQSTESELLNSVLWAQTSVEHDAAYLQAYRIGRLMLDRALSDKTWTAALEQATGYRHLPPAVILDVDETILDNSPEEAEKVVGGDRAGLWEDWVRQERSTALPGALEFTKYARRKGVAVFYVTNRDAASKPQPVAPWPSWDSRSIRTWNRSIAAAISPNRARTRVRGGQL